MINNDRHERIAQFAEQVITCGNCGCILHDEDIDATIYNTNDGVVCKDCLDMYYSPCERCSEWFDSETMIIAYDWRHDPHMFCESCADESYSVEKCDICGEWFYNDIRYARITDNEHTHEDVSICTECVSEYYYCEHCDEYFDSDYYNHDMDMCDECYDNVYGGDYISGYHEHDYDEFYGEENECFGIELEVENAQSDTTNADMARMLFEHFGERVVYEHDGSLDSGFEIITYPHDIHEFSSLNWKYALGMLQDNGFRSHDTNTCGLHMHVNRKMFGDDMQERYDNIAKVLYLYSHAWQFFLKLSRRTQSDADHWARKYTQSDYNEAKDNASKKGISRYTAVNLNNYDTVEFRLGKGTLNYDSFMAWIDLHLAIVNNSKHINEGDFANMAMWLDGIKQSTLEYIRKRDAFTALGIEEPEITTAEEKEVA